MDSLGSKSSFPSCQGKWKFTFLQNYFLLTPLSLSRAPSFVEDPPHVLFSFSLRSFRGEKMEVLTFIERGRSTRQASGWLSVNTGWGTRRSIVWHRRSGTRWEWTCGTGRGIRPTPSTISSSSWEKTPTTGWCWETTEETEVWCN